jgi:hypothetical protein
MYVCIAFSFNVGDPDPWSWIFTYRHGLSIPQIMDQMSPTQVYVSMEWARSSFSDFVGMNCMVHRSLGRGYMPQCTDCCVMAKYGLCRDHGPEHVSGIRSSWLAPLIHATDHLVWLGHCMGGLSGGLEKRRLCDGGCTWSALKFCASLSYLIVELVFSDSDRNDTIVNIF